MTLERDLDSRVNETEGLKSELHTAQCRQRLAEEEVGVAVHVHYIASHTALGMSWWDL